MTPYPEGALVQEQSRPEVVYRITGGRKLHVPSAYTFDALGLTWSGVTYVPDGALSHPPTETWPNTSPGVTRRGRRRQGDRVLRNKFHGLSGSC